MAYTPPTQVIGTGFKVSSVFATTSDITLYVRTTGSDSNDGLTSGTALLTVQEAISRIPLSIGHAVVVDIGEGTFGGFTLSARSYTTAAASLLIKGVTGLATGLASGTNSGTATGGTTITLIDAGQSWTVDDLRGRMALVNGEYRVIYSNDATSIRFVGPFTLTCSGKAYQIVEQKTILNTLATTDAVLAVGGQVATNLMPPWTIQDIKVTTPSGSSYFGIKYMGTCGGITSRVAVTSLSGQTGWAANDIWGNMSAIDVYTSGGAYGLSFRTVMTVSNDAPLERIFCYNATTIGMLFNSSPGANTYDAYLHSCPIGVKARYGHLSQWINVHIESCSTAGIVSEYNQSFYINGSRPYIGTCGVGVQIEGTQRAYLYSTPVIENCTSHGVQLKDPTGTIPPATSLFVAATKIQNNGGSGIYARGICQIYINSLATAGGTGNTRFGLELEDGARAYVKSGIIANPLTGAMGDAAIDDAKTVLTWATDFATNLASVTDDVAGTGIRRRD